MAPAGGEGLSAARAQYAGPSGMKGIISNGKTSSIALFAALGGFVYGYNQGMFGQILTMTAFTRHVGSAETYIPAIPDSDCPRRWNPGTPSLAAMVSPVDSSQLFWSLVPGLVL